MRWELRYARDGWAIESGQYERNAGGLPAWYLDRPTPVRGDDFYLRAFWELSTERQYGEVLGPIPNSKVADYGYRHGLNPGMIGVLETVIRELDEHWIKWQREEQKRREAKPKPSKK